MQGILMTPDDIRATAERQKTATRRVIKPQPIDSVFELKEHSQLKGYWIPYSVDKRMVNNNPGSHKNDCGYVPKYQVGEVVYIEEAWRVIDMDTRTLRQPVHHVKIEHRIDGCIRWVNMPATISYTIPDKWHSPLHMAEITARYFIKIKGILPQRLQDITEEEIIAEGIEAGLTKIGYYYAFVKLWNSINGKTYPWKSSPWVWAYTYELVDRSSE